MDKSEIASSQARVGDRRYKLSNIIPWQTAPDYPKLSTLGNKPTIMGTLKKTFLGF